ncbi:hypothetical protein ACIQNU_04095 [Streptomyces sp. NPDC091292]|uniref:hypothetical protein n=1 Tax=Streptomyces sp. NPDC091292 TaxID=3365991 RepID=UPI00380D71C6
MTDLTETARVLLRDAESYLSALHGSVARHDNLGVNLGCAGCELRDRIAEVLPTLAVQPSADRADLRDRVAAAICERQNPGRRYADCEHPWQADAEADADAVLAVLPADGTWDSLVRETGRLRCEGAALRDRAAEVDARVAGLRRQVDADRAAVLSWAACIAEQMMDERYGPDCSYAIGGLDVARELRRLAGEAQQAEPEPLLPPETTWRVETRWHTGEWRTTGRSWDSDRDWVVEGYERATGRPGVRAYRLVRATTTFTVESESLPAVSGAAAAPETEA